MKKVLLLIGLIVSLSGCALIRHGPTPRPTPAPMATPVPSPQILSLCGVYQVIATEAQAVTAPIVEQTRGIIESRVHASGVVQPVVRAEVADRIVVELPVMQDLDAIRKLITTVGRIGFIPVPDAFFNSITDGQPLPPDMPVTPIFSGDQISDARPGSNQTGQLAVDIELTAEAARLFDEYAAAHQGGRFAIVLDGIVISAPTINADHFDGKAQISGSFTEQTVNELVTVLKSGSLPLAIREISFGPCGARPSG